MPHFELEAVQANKGDALILRWENGDGERTMLVDGGHGTAWTDHVLVRLHELVGNDPAGKPQPIVLDAVVVSHVDEDHIKGILDLTDQIGAADKNPALGPAPQVVEVWHNSFADMQFVDDFADEPELQEILHDIAVDPSSFETLPASVGSAEELHAGTQSVTQGRSLDAKLKDIAVPKNATFGGGFVRQGPSLDFHGLTVRVLGPNDALLAGLKGKWKKELQKFLKKEADRKKAAGEAFAASLKDRSVPNQSSIVLLVELDGRKVLLTGDARHDHLLEALEVSPDIGPLPLRVDVYKVPHHGSIASNSPKLWASVQADHYVISGNGEHGNPHPQVLTDLFASAAGRKITVYLTNRPEAGAKKDDDKQKAKQAQAVLDESEKDPNVTIVYRNDSEHAVRVSLIDP